MEGGIIVLIPSRAILNLGTNSIIEYVALSCLVSLRLGKCQFLGNMRRRLCLSRAHTHTRIHTHISAKFGFGDIVLLGVTMS